MKTRLFPGLRKFSSLRNGGRRHALFLRGSKITVTLLWKDRDVREAPQKWFGDEDYEFWVTVKAEDKDSVILFFR